MADDVKRLNYFDKQFLHEEDFNDEQAYHVRLQRDHARLLHTPGIAEGLTIPDPPAGATAVTVNAGVAYDNLGRRIVLANNYPLELKDLPADQSVYVTIAYAEAQTDPTAETGITGNTRWTEKPVIERSASAPAKPEEMLVLARIERSGITVSSVDRGERRTAGVTGGDLAVSSLKLTSESIAPAGWVKAALGASGRADIGGSLRVGGDLVVTGSIQGNIAVNTVETGDLVDNAVTSPKIAEADGTSGQNSNAGSGVKTAHIQDAAVTLQKLAPDVRPIVSVDGVSSPGGNVDLIQSGAITITPDDANNRVTIGETHSTRTDNPHATTAAQAGALVSVDGVSNPGGNIDLVPAAAISITPDNTGKRITIGETHSVATGNPHGTTAAHVGALVSVDGVSNPGGNVDLIQSGAITITPDDANNRVTIGEAHSTNTQNPHATTATQVGALGLSGGTISGSLTVSDNLRVSLSTLQLGDANPVESGNHIGLGQPGGKNVTVFVSATSSPTVSTGLKTAMMIWPVTTGYSALHLMAAAGGIDTLTVEGTARFNGPKIGFVADTFVNGSGQVLRSGDIVKLKTGGSIRFQGDNNRIPVPEVTLSDRKNDPLVIGVVAQEATPSPDEPDHRTEPEDPTSIPEGGLLFVVTLGTFAHCRVDATQAPVELGDLLTSSGRPGFAEKATDPKIGAIIGKALEALPGGTGYISVFVNIQ